MCQSVENRGVCAPIRGMRPVIHRDGTFEHEGHRYTVIQGGPGWGYAIHNESGVVVADNLFTLAEVRDYVEQGFLHAAGETP